MATTKQEMPIFTKTYDLLSWLLPATNHFPKAHRHTFTERVLNAAFDTLTLLQTGPNRANRHSRVRGKDALKV